MTETLIVWVSGDPHETNCGGEVAGIKEDSGDGVGGAGDVQPGGPKAGRDHQDRIEEGLERGGVSGFAGG